MLNKNTLLERTNRGLDVFRHYISGEWRVGRNFLNPFFGKQKHYSYADLCEQIQSILDVKERTAKNYIKFMRNREIILKDTDNQNYFILGQI